jgi:mannose-6-phosphate isomerase-like protein (cupin superfamily)
MRALLALGLVTACGQATAPVATPAASAPVVAPADAAVTDDEKLAAIQKAMNELSPAAQQCWAAIAVERFDVEGELAAQIDIGPPAHANLVHDTTKNAKLAACVRQLLEAYPWAPPLRGQVIQLPFKFSAPDGQSVIDRRLVPFVGQGSTGVAVLLDDSNTGNPNASMFELAIAAGGSTGMREATRAELWWFRGVAEVRSIALAPTRVAADTVMYVPAGGAREVRAIAGDVHAVIVVTPGGHEGAARAGALPTPEVTAARAAPARPVILTKPVAANGHDIFLEPATVAGTPMSASIATIADGQVIPEHVHAKETELLYFVRGGGVMTIGGVEVPIGETSVVQIPPNTKHSFTAKGTAKGTVRALQLYTPAGPEQRWK